MAKTTKTPTKTAPKQTKTATIKKTAVAAVKAVADAAVLAGSAALASKNSSTSPAYRIDADNQKWLTDEDGVESVVVEGTLRKSVSSLTEEERALMPVYYRRWLKRCCDTSPADWTAAIAAVSASYKRSKLPVPKVFLKANSPSTCIIAGPIADLIVQTGCNPEKTIMTTIELLKRAQCLQKGANDLIKDISLEEVEKCLRSVTYVRLDGTPFDETGASLEDVKVTIRNNGFQYRLLQPWTGWFGYCAFVREVLRLDIPEWNEYLPDEQAARSCHMVWYGDAAAVIGDRPEIFEIEEVPNADGRGNTVRMHGESGPCLKYRGEAWGLYFIHGFQVEKKVVLAPETQTIREIDSDNNAETRRIRIERFGWIRYITESGAKTIHSRRNQIDNQDEILVEMKDKTRRIVLSDPSTARMYCLGVPNTIKTCEDAQFWLSHGLASRSVHRS